MIAASIIVTTIDIFIIVSILHIISELTGSNELTFISSFICLLIAKVHMGKLE